MSQEHLLEMPPTTEKWFCLGDGQNLRNLALAGMLWLDHNRQHVNELNVFPVPDGDTGTNMLLTMRSAYKRIDNMTDGAMPAEWPAKLRWSADGRTRQLRCDSQPNLARSCPFSERQTCFSTRAIWQPLFRKLLIQLIAVSCVP